MSSLSISAAVVARTDSPACVNSRDKKHVLFNCTSNVVGGAVQNAANFVLLASADDRFSWSFALSPQVLALVKDWRPGLANYTVLDTPAKSREARKALRALADELDVDAVYTMAGPCYTAFRKPHLLGLSNAYITHAGWEGFLTGRSLLSAAKVYAKALVQRRWALRADHWVFQTVAARDGFRRRHNIPISSTGVVPNAVGEAFSATSRGERRPTDLFSILCPGADYPHKHLRILPYVARELSLAARNKPMRIVLTIDLKGETWRVLRAKAEKLGVGEMLQNFGPFKNSDAARLHSSSDMVLLPSVLETFSTSYLEAMAAELPLVVPDRDFVREICGDGAIYYDCPPLSVRRAAVAAAQAIVRAVTDTENRRAYHAVQKEVLAKYGTYENRFRHLTDELTRFLERIDAVSAKGA